MLNRVGAKAIGAVFVLLAVLFTQPAFAANYGDGPYGNCQFGNCTTTTTTTSTGLEISVNLSPGQTIPKSGYTIVITPLNGQGRTFKTAEIYVDGALRQTLNPDADGTARWFWDVSGLKKQATVKVVVTDLDGGQTVKEFVVNIESDDAAVNLEQLSSLPEPLRRAFHALPAPVVYAFPYILLTLLAIQIVVLLLQTKRELSEYRILLGLLNRHRANDEAKHTFMQLASHHLRTPLTVLGGGVDLLTQSRPVNLPSIQASTEKMRSSIELLITQAEAGQQAGYSPRAINPAEAKPWRHPGLFVPVILIGITALVFTYLASAAGGFSISQVNLVTQIIVYAILALLVYQTFRWRQLKRRDRMYLQQLVDEEADTVFERDNLVANTSLALSRELSSFKTLVSVLPAGTALELINEGVNRLQVVVSKFNTALRLRNSRSTDAPTTVLLNTVLANVIPHLTDALQQRKITVSQTADCEIMTHDPKLFAQVMWDVLDNAAAYGQEGSVIQVGATKNASSVEITVTNQGADIPPQKLSMLFMPFYKAEGAEIVTHEGMGFSLYLDKIIMDYLGGQISIDSHAGQITVSLKMPITNSPA